ncbi:MAG: hypothetical protein NZM35_05810, partial [Chitinophagales bacterium]|nr:hypothetical protein [Chitinophagales bacterium]
NNTLAYGIVVTPDCDLENKSCRQIQIIEVRKLDDNTLGLNNDMRTQIRKYSHQSLFSLPSIYTDNGLTDFVAVLKHKIIVHEKDIDNGPSFPKSSRRFQYSHTYILNAQDVKMNLICSIVNPYKAEFLQKLHTNNSRVGIPDIKDLL